MSILDEYRRNATECQRMAEKAGNAKDKASWLRLAASWLGMIKGALPTAPAQESAKQVEKSAEKNQKKMHWPVASKADSQVSH